MEIRGNKTAYGEYYRVVGNNSQKQSITYLVGVTQWASGESYKTTQLVRVPDYRSQYSGNYQIYRCKVDHTSGNTFASDVATKWEQLSLHLQEIRDDINVDAPLTHDSVTNTFSIPQSDTDTDGYLSSGDWNLFNNKQLNYTYRFIGSITNAQALLLSNTAYTGKFECMLYNANTTQVVSYFNIIRTSNTAFDMYIKNDENLISDTQNSVNTFNVYLDSNTNNFYLQNNLGYTVYYNVYRTSFKTSFDPLNP